MKTITVYGKNDCRDCEAAKKYLDANIIPFNYVNISENAEKRDWLIGEGRRAVPQFYFENELIIDGGWKAFREIPIDDIKQKLL